MQKENYHYEYFILIQLGLHFSPAVPTLAIVCQSARQKQFIFFDTKMVFYQLEDNFCIFLQDLIFHTEIGIASFLGTVIILKQYQKKRLRYILEK